MKATDCNIWFPARGGPGEYTGRLVILPHAGSGTAPWFRWSEVVPPWVKVLVARLPGRETRLNETPLTSPDEALSALTKALADLPPLPTVLFGHSLGARFAFGLCQRLPKRVQALVASGSPAPSRRSTRPPMAALPNAVLARAAQQRWGTVPADILASHELQELFLPALRADLAIEESWPIHPYPPLSQALVVVAGNDDPEMTVEDLESWSAQTTGPSYQLRHPGGHMAVLQNDAVRRRVAAACVERFLV